MKNIFIGNIDELVELVSAIISDCLYNSRRHSKSKEAKIGYGDAVSAIMEGFTFDSNKCEALDMLKRDADIGYYKAVIAIIQNAALDSTKLEMIDNLNG